LHLGGGSLPLRAHFVGRYPLCGLKRRPQRLLAENRYAVLPTGKAFLKYRGSDGRGAGLLADRSVTAQAVMEAGAGTPDVATATCCRTARSNIRN